jgi:S-adenosylmethionine hydrolase
MLVTLTSDFGWGNEGPGIMAATVLGICPTAAVVQLSHGVLPYSVIDGARQMECVTTIHPGVHVCVVDPGVGSDRLGVVLDVPSLGYLVGPNNGVLMAAARRAGGVREARSIENSAVIRRPLSSSFHGRDVFASVAGHLAAGWPFKQIGNMLTPAELIPAPYNDALLKDGQFSAIVLHINRFGNCILNLLESTVCRGGHSICYRIRIEGRDIGVVKAVPSFSFVEKDELLLYPDAYGRVGLARNQANAAETLQLHVMSGIDLALLEK